MAKTKIRFRRRRIKLRRRVPKEAVHLFDRLLAIHAQGLDAIPETRGGRMNEYNRASYRLADLMGIDRWQGHPLDCGAPIAPDWIASNAYRKELYENGYKARRLLERASKAKRTWLIAAQISA